LFFQWILKYGGLAWDEESFGFSVEPHMVTKATYPVHLTPVLFESRHDFLDTNFLLKQHNAIFFYGLLASQENRRLWTHHTRGGDWIVNSLKFIFKQDNLFPFFNGKLTTFYIHCFSFNSLKFGWWCWTPRNSIMSSLQICIVKVFCNPNTV
jgi:hypothetical protein